MVDKNENQCDYLIRLALSPKAKFKQVHKNRLISYFHTGLKLPTIKERPEVDEPTPVLKIKLPCPVIQVKNLQVMNQIVVMNVKVIVGQQWPQKPQKGQIKQHPKLLFMTVVKMNPTKLQKKVARKKNIRPSEQSTIQIGTKQGFRAKGTDNQICTSQRETMSWSESPGTY
ncbi:hypothetical protein BpHYR1_044610 [Brachionus plicatilis]|uniref:Uncharacterized protein n=1 Tax=Brachionus plicatilis TaxID=10195 RepID=A0A3M7P7Y2_BRAPC|nr:hypothetical protein BpHYR1_044610 [Brachionus plicatilis]